MIRRNVKAIAIRMGIVIMALVIVIKGILANCVSYRLVPIVVIIKEIVIMASVHVKLVLEEKIVVNSFVLMVAVDMESV